MLFDQLPVPLLSGDRHTMDTFGPFLSGFVPVPVEVGNFFPGRYLKERKSQVLVPEASAIHTCPDTVPSDRHMAMMGAGSAYQSGLREGPHMDYYLDEVVFRALRPCSPCAEPEHS